MQQHPDASSNWHDHCTPYSPIDEQCYAEELSSKDDETASIGIFSMGKNSVAFMNTVFEVKNIRGSQWQPLDSLTEWLALPYKFKWRVSIPLSLMRYVDTQNEVGISIQLVRCNDYTIMDKGLTLQLKSRRVDATHCILIVALNPCGGR